MYKLRLLQRLREARGSICATTLGRGPDGFYFGEAEENFWAVWRPLGAAYSLTTWHTQITGALDPHTQPSWHQPHMAAVPEPPGAGHRNDDSVVDVGA